MGGHVTSLGKKHEELIQTINIRIANVFKIRSTITSYLKTLYEDSYDEKRIFMGCSRQVKRFLIMIYG